jgi:tetratricopeptide (TPR) repeat protein
MRLLPSSLLVLLVRATVARADAVDVYYQELVKEGVVDVKSSSPETLAAELGVAEDAIEKGNPARAVPILYGIVESPRYSDFSDSVGYQNAEYDLIVALNMAGAYQAGLDMALRAIQRGPAAPYFSVAHRRAVDAALATRDYAGVLAKLEALKLAEKLPPEAESERDYLRGRAAFEKGDTKTAEDQLGLVSRKSRLYPSSLYLRGVMRAKAGDFASAADAFCEIAQTGDDDRYAFMIDDRYFKLKDLAQLGAGRIAHEEGRYDDAYYHYFQIPDDSDRLPEALLEGAWSMYQKKEYRTARELIEELVKSFPGSPEQPEALLLDGYIDLADCQFEDSEKKFDKALADVEPVLVEVGQADASAQMRVDSWRPRSPARRTTGSSRCCASIPIWSTCTPRSSG